MTDDLDRVLEGLRRVEAPVGLEGRVLRAMEAPRERGFAWGWAGAVALVLVGVWVGGWVRRERKTAGFADTPAFHEAERIGHAERAEVVVEKGRAAEADRHHRGPSTASIARCATDSAQDDDVCGRVRLVVEEAGFPAPPEPLSEQEKLLLRLARRPNEGTVAMFDPKIREERAEAEKAEFEFFNPQPAVIAAEPEEIEHVGKQVR